MPPRKPSRLATLVLVALVLGAVSTVLVATGSVYLDPMRTSGWGVVERDGDHLQLWVLRMESWTASRRMWFEKGRIYSKPGVGPAGGSSAAVACWSFATGTRQNPRYSKGNADLPMEERGRIQESPARVWGVAIDRRGWPFEAMEGVAAGTMNGASPDPYVAESGWLVWRPGTVMGFGGGAPVRIGGSDSLADLRIIPGRMLGRGFVLDVLFFGAAWWIVLRLGGEVVGRVRARARSRRNLCRGCGYDLSGLAGDKCPECGGPVVPEGGGGRESV